MVWALGILACGRSPTLTGYDSADVASTGDAVAPTILVTPYAEAQPLGVDLRVTADITDEGGVLAAQLWYKNEVDGHAAWESAPMAPEVLGSARWNGVIPAAAQRSGGMDYYLEAVDRSQNAATAPEAGPASPFHVRLSMP